jgi:hypothetical protein
MHAVAIDWTLVTFFDVPVEAKARLATSTACSTLPLASVYNVRAFEAVEFERSRAERRKYFNILAAFERCPIHGLGRLNDRRLIIGFKPVDRKRCIRTASSLFTLVDERTFHIQG